MTSRRTWSILLLALLVATSVLGQSSTTATLRGKITNAQGNGVANAEINAVETATGFVHTVHAGSDGSYRLGGLSPGLYNIVIAAQGYEPKSQDVTVLVGQTLDVNVNMSANAVLTESITVVGTQAVETRTSEVATNVTTHQIENLPQDNRNFLNFAAMAPGIRLSADPQRKTFAGDAQDAEQTNIFIDGVSNKNDVLLGGAQGQDSSRGNPFPQSAVQEFRVITQNFSAQYDHASSAIITAVTKSGGNQLRGQAFVFYQPKAWVAPLAKGFQYSTLTGNNDYYRTQPGINIGGPIIKDKLHYFATYESVDEHATTGTNYAPGAAAITPIGIFPSPFKQQLAFGKLSWQALSNQEIDLTGSYRHEHETRDFGGQTSFQSATDLRNWVYEAGLHHNWNNNSALNEASLSFQKYGWNPTPLTPGVVGMNFEGCCRLGGNSTVQEFQQRRVELRDNFNFAPMNMAGLHNIQVGGNFDSMHYDINKSLFGNPQFDFRNDVNGGYSYTGCTPANLGTSACQPYQAQYGFGNPFLSTNNNEYGIYGQDNWAVNNNLSFNIGLRWDYESHMLDENFVTPPNIVAALKGKTFQANGRSWTIPDRYFSTGTERKPYKDEIQPRLGFTYDLSGNSRSVAFGGWGRYYDRLYLNATLDERYRLQFPVYRIQFAAPGAPCGGAGQGLCWQPSYFSAAGLNNLIASGVTSPEIHLLSNDTKPPYSNQWTLGFRQQFGTWLASASYNQVRGYRGITWASATGTCCQALAPGFGAVILSDPAGGKKFWYDGQSISLDRPFANNWGVHVVYTHSKAEQNGNDLFSLDLPTSADYAKHPVPGSEPNHIVGTGIFGIPWGMTFSTTVTLGTGPATVVTDLSQGFDLAGHEATGVFNRAVYPGDNNCAGCPSGKTLGFGYRSFDLRLEKGFALGATNLAVIGEVFNLTNAANYGCLNNFIPPTNDVNYANSIKNLGMPNCVVGLGRREQIGLRYNF